MDYFYPTPKKESFHCQKFDLERSSSGLADTRSSSVATKINDCHPSTVSSHQMEYTLASRYGSKKLLNSTLSSLSKKSHRALDQYAIKKTLGTGSFAKVKLCVNVSNGERLAVKIIEKQNVKSLKLRTSVKREIRLNKLIFHPNIVQVLEMLETESTIFIMMEYVEGGELFDYIIGKRHLQEKEARHFFRQIVSAIDYLHRSSIVHRDLKPENLLLDASRQTIKLVDFGLGNTWQKEVKLETFCGSPYYAAPEMIAATPYTGPEVDVWSMGVVLYAMVSGRLPFDSSCMRALYNAIMNGDYSIPQFFSAELSRLITRMLRVNPASRCTVEEVADDKWTNIGFTERPPHHVPYRTDIITNPNRKSISELSSFGIKESDIIGVLRDPNNRQHPLTSLYHLCNETRQRIEQAEVATRQKENVFPDFRMDCLPPVPDKLDYRKFTLRDKLASSKMALAFKKWIKTGLKPLPHRRNRETPLNAVWSAQVLPSMDNRVRMEINRKPVATYLDSDTAPSSEFRALPSGQDPDRVFQSLEKRNRQTHKPFQWSHKKSISDGYEFLRHQKLAGL